MLEEELKVHACIRIHMGKTAVWNQAGLRPPVCDVLERLARIEGIPEEEQGIKVLGSLLRHPAFVARHLERTSSKDQVLFDRIQSAWLLLLHCACARANYLLRVVRPSAAANFAETHDRAVWQCLANILITDLSECNRVGMVTERPRVSVVLLIGLAGQIASP